ncbi:glycosyltransferase family 43, partial [Ostertagia ostertagi]
RAYDYFRLSQTLNHIRNLHWIVVEDGSSTVNAIERLLHRSTIPPCWDSTAIGLQYYQRDLHPQTASVIYFADDDNSYDVRLFDKYIRKVKRLGIWPYIWLIMSRWGVWVDDRSGSNGKVDSWYVSMLLIEKSPDMEDCDNSENSGFGFKKQDAEPFGYNDTPKDILVWHTKTTTSKGSGPLRGFVIE